MTRDPAQKLALALNGLLNRIFEYISTAVEHVQPFGACLVNPKFSAVKPPTKEIQKQLEEYATNYFMKTKVKGYYFKYITLPLSPIKASGPDTDAVLGVRPREKRISDFRRKLTEFLLPKSRPIFVGSS